MKAVLKGKIYGKEIDEALKSLEGALSNFKQEAEICSEQRLGRLEEHILSIRETLDQRARDQKETSRLDALKPKARKTSESGERRGHAPNLDVLNTIYKLLTSSNAFDCLTGKGESTTRRIESTVLLTHRRSSRTRLPLGSRQRPASTDILQTNHA